MTIGQVTENMPALSCSHMTGEKNIIANSSWSDFCKEIQYFHVSYFNFKCTMQTLALPFFLFPYASITNNKRVFNGLQSILKVTLQLKFLSLLIGIAL